MVCKTARLISYQGRPNWHRGITPLCADSKRDVSTLDVSISNNCDLEARGIALGPPPHPPPICWLLNSTRASWFWVLGWKANQCYLRVFYWVNWVWLLFFWTMRIQFTKACVQFYVEWNIYGRYYPLWGLGFVSHSFRINTHRNEWKKRSRERKTVECGPKLVRTFLFSHPSSIVLLITINCQSITSNMWLFRCAILM